MSAMDNARAAIDGAAEPCRCTYASVGDGTNECPRSEECYGNWLKERQNPPVEEPYDQQPGENTDEVQL